MFQKLTPILRVENIEPHLDFWVNRLGFTKVMEVKEGEEVGFVILTLGHIEVMLQTRVSLAKDIPALAKGDFCVTVLYLGITDLEEIEKKLIGVEVIVPKRQTTYGANEIWVRAPGGHVVGFAAAS
jgi:uncharacterized glyoxalase superfamily protein PhnB